VQSLSYDEDSGLWVLVTDACETVICRYAILAIGALSEPKAPDISGVDNFAGEAYFTSNWPKEGSVDLSGKRVGVIGTGSSGVQVIPEIANVAAEVCVFQRTANYVTPTRSGPMDPRVVARLRADPQAIRRAFRESFGGQTPLEMGDERFVDLDEAGRERALQRAWDGRHVQLAFKDAYMPEANAAISDFIRARMHEQVYDKWTADHLIPWDHPYGGKRPCLSNVYLETFNQPHVHLIALMETPIEEIVSRGITTTAQTIALDVIVYATGFDAISGPVFAIDILGLGGGSMRDAWADGPMNYLGTMVRGFPNLFLPSSAMSPSVLSNMATLAEQQVDFIFDTIDWLDQHGRPYLHPLSKSQEFWREETLRYAKRRSGALTTKSWYSGANIPGKPRVFMVYCGGFKRYNETCYGELENGFPGYEIMTSPRATS
jgi:cation diffusion facilitator CzcD-associated flavoprotein CzcO